MMYSTESVAGAVSAVNESGKVEKVKKEKIKLDILIVGTGPAGASLACFLSSHGLTGTMLGVASSTADTPRAHITNMAALECLRDIGLDVECNKLAIKGDCMRHTRWAHDMAGEEYARIYSWGQDPSRKGDYESASPCNPVDLPQTLLEPVLIQYASQNGFKARFDSKFLSCTEDKKTGLITSIVEDLINGHFYEIESRFLFGADGARSQIMKQLELPLIVKPGQGLAINVLVKADLSSIMKNRIGNLHWILQPDIEHPDFAWIGIVRMVKPWNEWMFIFFPSPGAGTIFNPSKEQYLKRVHEFIGDNSIAVEILSISKWYVNETVAEQYSKGNIFCLGDAVHRHPPFNGLGSNTCIQDAFNLAWKVAYVIQGKAGKALLDTYSIERQPVGHNIITRANQAFREHNNVWSALGMLEHTISERMRLFTQLSEATPEGCARRAALKKAVEHTSREFHGLGIEMNQFYTSSAIFTSAEEAKPPYEKDEVLYYQPSTFPGSRLPHAWLNSSSPTTPISTIDLAGKGKFTLLSGIGGKQWKAASAIVSKELCVSITAYVIGFRQDYEDVYSTWSEVRAVEESGCILVRPDRFVCWRCKELPSDSTEALRLAMRSILAI